MVHSLETIKSIEAELERKHLQNDGLSAMASQASRVVMQFKEQLLLQACEAGGQGMSDAQKLEFLKLNGVKFVEFPDGSMEFHGFGRKLGDITIGFDSNNYLCKFTPVAPAANLTV